MKEDNEFKEVLQYNEYLESRRLRTFEEWEQYSTGTHKKPFDFDMGITLLLSAGIFICVLLLISIVIYLM